MAEKGISTLLNDIWSAYRRAGVTDDLRIIESLAALLLEQEDVPLDDDLPRKAQAAELDEKDIRQKLGEASKQVGSAGVLFDRYILFRLPAMRAGQYPTPRHIVRLMTALAETQGQSVADFACGSGGLLVHSSGESLAGIEITPEWARIARANLLLHGLQDKGNIETGNALRVLKESDKKYARIVMNPPFGAKVESDFGARSETALANLALDHLKGGGRAVLLAPSGLLFSGSQAERKIRQRLVDEVTLEAVITLPDDAFQPYSTLTTHLLLIQNSTPGDAACTWFLRPVYDGYVSGRGRDLTTDPRIPNDLILTEHAVAAVRQEPAKSDNVPLVAQALTEGNILLGVLIRPTEDVTLLNVRFLPGVENEPASLLVEAQRESQRTYWKVALTPAPTVESVEDAEALIHQRLQLKQRDALPAPDVFQNQSIRWGQSSDRRIGGILVKTYEDKKPQVMGVAIPCATLRQRDYALQPDDYLRPPEISAALRRPHDILLNIYQNQRDLFRRMDRLAGWLAPERPKQRNIPGRVWHAQPFGALSETQKAIWAWIARQQDNDGSAKPFTLGQIEVQCGEDEKRLALDIFEAMGLIVPITLKNPQNEQAMNFYRLAERNDQWAGAPEEESNEEREEA